MNNQDYDDKDEEGDEQEDPTSLEGKGWDVLAGGKQNPFEMGGDDPFDLKSPENPTPYTDDDEAHWILTSGAPAPTPQETPPDAYWDQGRSAQAGAGAPTPDQPAEAAPRDLSPEELGSLTSVELGADSGPITAPPELFEAMGSEAGARLTEAGPQPAGAEAQPLAGEDAGLSYGVSVTPVAPPVSGTGTPATGTGLSPGVDVTPLDSSGQPLGPPSGPSVPPHGHGPDVASPIPTLETPVGGPIIPPDAGPVMPPPPPPFVPATPPWDLPQQTQGLMPSDAFIRDPFFSPPRSLTGGISDEPLPKEDLAELLITSDRVNALWDEINETYNLVVDDVRGHFETTQTAIENLKQARALLLSGPENFDNAERLLIEVKARLRLEEKVRQWSRSMGTWLAVYLVVWLLILSAASFLTNRIDIITEPFVPQLLAKTWLPSLFGGLGGVIGALWVLVKHIAIKRDFDPIHTPWYVINPFMGVAMGVVTYFVLIGGGNLLLKAVDSNSQLPGSDSPMLLLLCIIIGFNQNVLWSLIDRVIDTIFPRPAEEETAVIDMPLTTDVKVPKSGPQG